MLKLCRAFRNVWHTLYIHAYRHGFISRYELRIRIDYSILITRNGVILLTLRAPPQRVHSTRGDQIVASKDACPCLAT